MDTEKIALIHMVIEYLAGIWARFFYPVAIDRTIETNGRKVRVRVDDTEDDTLKRLEDLTADRSQDA